MDNNNLLPRSDWQTQVRGSDDHEYQTYLSCADDGNGIDFTGNTNMNVKNPLIATEVVDETVYEVSWHYDGNDAFTHCTVHPIRVVRNSILPECSAPSITAIDRNGDMFNGSMDNYFTTEAHAWSSVKEELEQSLESCVQRVKALEKRMEHTRKLLEDLG